MEGELEPRGPMDPALMRVSDAERHRVAEVLREAAGEGRIDLEELDQRLEATYAARTYADLAPLTYDLPAHRDQPYVAARSAGPPRVVAGPDSETHLAILSGMDRKGSWVVPRRMTVLAMMGGVNLDMREAQFAAPEVVLTVNAFMGGASIVVGPHTHVVIEGMGIMGGYSGPSGMVPEELDERSTTLRVRGLAVWGGVSVERKRMPGSRWKSLRRK